MKMRSTDLSAPKIHNLGGGRPLLWFAIVALIVATLLMFVMFFGGEIAFPVG